MKKKVLLSVLAAGLVLPTASALAVDSGLNGNKVPTTPVLTGQQESSELTALRSKIAELNGLHKELSAQVDRDRHAVNEVQALIDAANLEAAQNKKDEEVKLQLAVKDLKPGTPEYETKQAEVRAEFVLKAQELSSRLTGLNQAKETAVNTLNHDLKALEKLTAELNEVIAKASKLSGKSEGTVASASGSKATTATTAAKAGAAKKALPKTSAVK